jgi:hypothetical protein
MDFSSRRDARVGIVAQDRAKTTNRRRGSVRVWVGARVSVVKLGVE